MAETALQGVRILDLTRALAGPFGSMILADLGVEVIKVEQPQELRPEDQGPLNYKGMGAFFIGVNRNKKSIALDLKREESLHVFYDLVRVSDVVFDNYRPDVTERLHIDYKTLSAINPRIICCSISGFGTVEPLRNMPAYDLTIQALSGAVAITGTPGGPPVRNGVAVADQGAGLLAAIGILAALHQRERTGRGTKVETSLLEGMIYQLAYEASIYFNCGVAQGPAGSGHILAFPYGIFKTADGHIAIAPVNRPKDLCRALDRTDILEDEGIKREGIWSHRSRINQELERTFQTKTTGEWLEILTRADIPCSPLLSLDQALRHPQVLATQMVVSVEHVLGGEVKVVGVPTKMTSTPPEARSSFTSPPLLGQHTDEVLKGLLDYPEERIAELREKGVIK